jgi:hypothetical protein
VLAEYVSGECIVGDGDGVYPGAPAIIMREFIALVGGVTLMHSVTLLIVTLLYVQADPLP